MPDDVVVIRDQDPDRFGRVWFHLTSGLARGGCRFRQSEMSEERVDERTGERVIDLGGPCRVASQVTFPNDPAARPLAPLFPWRRTLSQRPHPGPWRAPVLLSGPGP